MKKIKQILFFFLITGISVMAQKPSDSIINQQIEKYYSTAQKFLYRDIDSTRFYLWKCYKLSTEINDLNNKLGILSQLINSDGYHFNLDFLQYDIAVMDSVITNDPGMDTLVYKEAYVKFLASNKGNYYYKLNNLSKAKFNFQNLLSSLENSKTPLSDYDKNIKIDVLEFLASIASREGKYDLAKQYFNKAIDELENNKLVSWERQVMGVKYRLSKVLMNENKLEPAKKIQLESLKYLTCLGDDPGISNIIKDNYKILIDNYVQQDSLDIALKYLEESKKWHAENDPFQKKLDILAGDIFTKQNEYDHAESFYQSALHATQKYRNQQKHQDVAVIYAKLGNLYRSQKLFDKSLSFYQEGLRQLSADFESDQLINNPDPEKVFSKLELIRVLREKLKTLQNSYLQKNDNDYLNIALQTSYALVETLDALKPEFESKVDKQFLISEMYPAFYGMVEVAYVLYKNTNEHKYIEDAFHFMEKSKSILLLEATRNAQATSFGDIPEKIIDKEQQYRANIIHLEKKLFNQKKDTQVFDSLFRLKNRYYDFIKKIEQDYPKYHDLKYNAEVGTIESTISSIGNNKGVLDFFLTDQEIFLIAIEKNNVHFYREPFDEDFKNSCSKYYELVSRLNTDELAEIYHQGNRIYTKILKKPLAKLQSKELVIIPDGILNYIPFESLSLSEKKQEFIIKTHQVSYANSATLLQEQNRGSENRKNKLIAYAPAFRDKKRKVATNRSDLGPLVFNTQEAKVISDYFNGKVVIGKAASLQSFRNEIRHYNLLHFATHAAANDEFPDYSYLAFSSDKETPDLLYVKDLYAYNLDADLVTLSACQTGLGRLQRGEGMLSLARGFAYAGARSLVTTLWKINDQTTASLMKNFYENLSQAVPKDKALRQAKLSYLNESEDEFLQHPYYWAGFIITGNMAAVQTGISPWWWLLLLLIPMAFLFLKNRKRNRISLF